MANLFLLSNRFTQGKRWESATFEMLDLRRAAADQGIDVVPFGPDNIEIVAPSGEMPQSYFTGIRAAPADGLVVRGMSGPQYEMAGITTRTMTAQGSFCLDPDSRFSHGSSSKSATTIIRSGSGDGSDSILLSQREQPISHAQVARLVEALGLRFPAIVKPSGGRQGIGVVTVGSINDLHAKLQNLKADDLLVQRYERFVHEYRALLLDGDCVGIARKLKTPESITANAATGATFGNVAGEECQRIAATAKKMAPHGGLLGLDIGVTESGKRILIEANSAPQWRHFSTATGIDVAALIVDEYTNHNARQLSD